MSINRTYIISKEDDEEENTDIVVVGKCSGASCNMLDEHICTSMLRQ